MGVFTITVPVILAAEKQPLAFFTDKVNSKLIEAPALRLTVIGLAVKAPSVTVVIPVPEMLYVVGVFVVAV